MLELQVEQVVVAGVVLGQQHLRLRVVGIRPAGKDTCRSCQSRRFKVALIRHLPDEAGAGEVPHTDR